MSAITQTQTRRRLVLLLAVTAVAVLAYGLNATFAGRSNVAEAAFDAMWVQGDVASAKDYFALNYIGQDIGVGVVRGPEGAEESYQAYRAAVPDLAVTVDHQLTKDEKTAIVWHATGTHKGRLFGIDATNASLNIKGITIYTIVDGKIVEGQTYWHTPELVHQIGQLPSTVDFGAYQSQSLSPEQVQVHALSGVEEALNLTSRTYELQQLENLQLASDFIECSCEAQSFIETETTCTVEPVLGEGGQLQAGTGILSFFADNFVEHATFPQVTTAGSDRDQVASLMQAVSYIFPSAIFVDDIFADGEFVVVQNTLDMAQQLEFLGVTPQEDADFLSSRVDIMRIQDGKIVEHWGADDMQLFYQLGLTVDEER